MDPSLTIVLAGCGRWGRNILRDLVGLGTRVAVADPDPAARQLAAAGGAWRIAADAADLPDADGNWFERTRTGCSSWKSGGTTPAWKSWRESPVPGNSAQFSP